MKKKNLATAMAAAMMFGGVAPVVAHADNGEQVVKPVENGTTVDVAKTNGRELAKEVKTYTQVYNTQFTDTTSDDKLKDEYEVLYTQGTVGDKTPNDDVKILVTTKMESDEGVQAEKAKLEDTKDYIDNMITKGYYTKSEKSGLVDPTDLTKGTQNVVTLNPTEVGKKAGRTEVLKYTFKNVPVEAEKEVVINIDFPTSPLNVTTPKGVAKLNKLAYQLEQNKANIIVDQVEQGNDLQLNVYKKDKDGKKGDQLGQATLRDFKAFKASDYKGYVNVAAIKDLNSLEQSELSWAKPAVMDALYNGQLKGYEDNTLKLNGNVTRAEFARMLVQLRGESVKEADLKENFSDVNPSDWFYKDVATLASLGIVKGDGNGTFRPDDTITRQEAAVMIAKAINGGKDVDQFYSNTGKPKDTKTDFKDDTSIAVWADGAVNTLSKESAKDAKDKVINGYEDNTFRPENNITRAESIVMLTNSNARASVSIEK